MTNAFFIFNPSTQEPYVRDDKIIPDPVTLGVTEVVIDGKKEVITATSGVQQYTIVEADAYPLDAAERQAVNGSIASK